VTLPLLYTHYFGFIVLVAEGLGALLYLWQNRWERGALRLFATGAVAVTLGVLPLLPVMIKHAAIDRFWIPQPGPLFLIDYYITYFHSLRLAAVTGVAIVAAVGSVLLPAATPWQLRAVPLLLIWIVLTYALPWLRGFVGQPVITERNTIMVLPALLLLAARGITLLPGAWLQRALLAFLLADAALLLFVKLDYYHDIKKEQFRETAQLMRSFEPRLPVYTLQHNDTKYNVYFTQQHSGLVASDISELEPLLAESEGPSLFWLADGHLRTLQTDVDERYHLAEVGRIENYATVAVLMVNPAKALRITLGEIPAKNQAVFAAVRLPQSAVPLRLLVAANAATRAEFDGEIRIELLAADGRVISDYANTPGSLPIVLPLGIVLKGTGLHVRLPAGQLEPEVWLLP